MKIGNIKIRRKYKINDIKVGIAKVFPSLINLEVNPTKEKQVFNHENSYGYDEVVVNPVTNEVDENIKPNNIRAGVNILGVEGNIEHIEYWADTPPDTSNFNLTYYIKQLPTYLDISNTSKPLQFTNYYQLEVADLRKWDLSKTNQMSFSNNPMLREVNLDGCDMSSMMYLYSLFYSCKKLKKVSLKVNPSKVESLTQLFSYCEEIEEIDLSTWHMSNLTDTNMMFWFCAKLKRLDIRNFTFDKVTNHSNMFGNNPSDCLIIVKDDTAKTWITSKFKTLTNVKTVAELEG